MLEIDKPLIVAQNFNTSKQTKVNLITFAFFVFAFPIFSQPNYPAIDEKSKNVPDSLIHYSTIANYLTHDLVTDTEKARAIYIWIAHNIWYDLSKVSSGKRYFSSAEILDEVFANRTGVCQHYSELFHAMSRSVGLESFLITGYTRDVYGEIADLSHAWNGIKTDTGYYFLDVTWAAGYEQKGKYIHEFRDEYFLLPPTEFITDHMPFDPVWQFLDNPVSNQQFIAKDFSHLNKPGNYAFPDSIEHHLALNDLNQLENATRRIIENGIKNDLIQTQVDENNLQLTNLRFNHAIDTMNTGIDSYNLYVSHKNRQFLNPKLSDDAITAMIENAEKGVYAAEEMLRHLQSTNHEMNRSIKEASNSMPELVSAIRRERYFVDKYLKRWKPLRIFMFYTYGG